MKALRKFLLGILLSLALVQQTCHAEDIDIYSALAGGAGTPNVLIILDNSSNWSAFNQGWEVDGHAVAQGQLEMRSIKAIVNSINPLVNPINLGLMMLTTVSGNPGGMIVFGVKPMTDANKALWNAWLDARYDNITDSNWKADSAANYGAAMFDAFKYFGGYTYPAHATDNVAGTPVDREHFGPAHYATIDPARVDPTAYTLGFTANSGDYIPPIPGACSAKTYIIFIGNGFPNADNVASKDDYSILRDNVHGDTTAVDTNHPIGAVANIMDGGGKIYSADEWARFLYQTDVNALTGQQNVTTYALNVFGPCKTCKDQKQINYLYNMSKGVGGGKYFEASDADSITKNLERMFAEIQSVNSVFASSSLPVSVNTQGTYKNQVFIGMFRPDATGLPRWAGNVKQYQFGVFTSGTDILLKLVDAIGVEAISATTGFVTPCAQSFWSSDTGTYWNYSGSVAKGTCSESTAYSDLPDGEVVEKGGAAQRLRGVTLSGGVITPSTFYSTRALKTCSNATVGACTALMDFDNTTHVNSTNMPGLNPLVWTQDMIDWVRGKDVDDENLNLLRTEMRPSAQGDVVHSQPVAIDYGSTTGVVVYYGTNEGVFHAINGNQTNPVGSTMPAPGSELWGFIAPETVAKISRLRSNLPLVAIPGIDPLLSTPKDYFFDGSVSAYQNSSSNKAWIYATMRRGGRAIYAFDVSTPTSPTLKWRKGCFTNDTTATGDLKCLGGWSSIGQTWSKPQIGYLNGYVDASSKSKPVLVFGGGYDTCEDTNSQTRCTTTPRKGANIWFIDADTGGVIRTYPTNYSVPGDIKLVTDQIGNITKVYAADTGGYVYRINVGTYDGSIFSDWSNNDAASTIMIAALSETNHQRKFLTGPDVVETATYNAVLIGSGDREHPLLNDYPCGDYSTSAGHYVTNEFYMIKDPPVLPPAAPTPASCLSSPPAHATPACLNDLTNNLTATAVDVGSYGWRFSFLNKCEQTINKAVTIGGVTSFGTNQPTQPSLVCGNNLGTARGYAVNVLAASPWPTGVGTRSVTYLGGGMPPSPVAGVVELTPGGQKFPFILGGGVPGSTSGSPLEGRKVDIVPPGVRSRTYRYIEKK